MSGKYALIIGNTEYTDPGLAQLTAPGKDAEDFARVLMNKEIGAFDDVAILLDQASSTIIEAIELFFDQKKPDDLLILYFSGHGVRDELGSLYLAVKNTNRSRLRSTAIKSDYIRESMEQSRSKRQVLILDCCNSGAFAQGTKAATGTSIGTASAFEAGYGRVVLTASDSTQFAWEGDKVIGETDNSLFTHYLVDGLKGEADLDGDGRITVDELYDYAYEKVRLATPKQTPSKFSNKEQGEIVVREDIPIDDIRGIPLPVALLTSIENPLPDIRIGAVRQLSKLLSGKNPGLARSSREILEKIATEDDSYHVRRVALQALETFRQAGQKVERIPNAEPKRQPSLPPKQPIGKNVTENRSEQPANSKLLLSVFSIALVLSLFLCGGWAVWRYVISPIENPPSPIPTTEMPHEVIPPTIIAVTETPPEVVATTPAPQDPDPVQTIINYWNYFLTPENYDLAWDILSPQFQQRNHESNFENYEASRENDRINKYCSVVTDNGHLLTESASNTAIVLIQVIYYMKPDCWRNPYDFEIKLIYDNEKQMWLYDETIKATKVTE